MYDPQDDEATREAEAVDATDMAPTVMSAPSGAVVDALAWSQEDESAGAEPVPYVEELYYDQDLSTGHRPTVAVPAAPIQGRRAPSLLPRAALGVGGVVALIAVAGALYSLTRSEDDETPVAPVTSAVVTPTPTPLAPSPQPSTPAPPPVATTSEPPPQTATEATADHDVGAADHDDHRTADQHHDDYDGSTDDDHDTAHHDGPADDQRTAQHHGAADHHHGADDHRIPAHSLGADSDPDHGSAELNPAAGLPRPWPDPSGAGTLGGGHQRERGSQWATTARSDSTPRIWTE